MDASSVEEMETKLVDMPDFHSAVDKRHLTALVKFAGIFAGISKHISIHCLDIIRNISIFL